MFTWYECSTRSPLDTVNEIWADPLRLRSHASTVVVTRSGCGVVSVGKISAMMAAKIRSAPSPPTTNAGPYPRARSHDAALATAEHHRCHQPGGIRTGRRRGRRHAPGPG